MSKISGEEAPKIQFTDPKLSKTQVDYMRLIEKQNLGRVQRLQRIRRNNILTGCILGGGVISIYLYSMFSVKQEKFLDDFEEPKKIQN